MTHSSRDPKKYPASFMPDSSRREDHPLPGQQEGGVGEYYFSLTIDGQEMMVRYRPNYFTSFPVGHFEFRSPHQPPRRIPVSETGYRSHFAPMPDIEAEGSPQEYARLLALTLIRASSKQKPDEEGKQPALF